MRNFLLITLLFACSTLTLSAQQNRAGNVELVEASADGNLLTFSVNGSANKKNDVIISAKETLFYKLLYQGVEGVNDGNKHILHEKKYWLDNFLTGKNAPYNALIEGIEQEGPVSKTTDGYFGTFNIVLKYKAFIKTLRLNGVIDDASPKTTSAAETKLFGLEAKKQPKPQPQSQPQSTPAATQTQPSKQTQTATETNAAPDKLVLTKTGFGPIQLDAIISKLPKSADGIYDRIEKVDVTSVMDDWAVFEYHVKSKGEDIAILAEFDGKVYSIDVVSDKLTTAAGLSLKSTAEQLLGAGAKSYCDNSGYVGLVVDGFLFRDMELSGSGLKKHEAAYLNGTDPVFSKSDYASGTRPKRITVADWYR